MSLFIMYISRSSVLPTLSCSFQFVVFVCCYEHVILHCFSCHLLAICVIVNTECFVT